MIYNVKICQIIFIMIWFYLLTIFMSGKGIQLNSIKKHQFKKNLNGNRKFSLCVTYLREGSNVYVENGGLISVLRGSSVTAGFGSKITYVNTNGPSER